MSVKNRILKHGGLIPTTHTLRLSSAPLRDGPDVSWLPRCLPGDDQGNDGACAIFAMANWVEIMFHTSISDEDCLGVYKAALDKAGRVDEGLTFEEAFDAAKEARWMGTATGIRQVTSLLEITDQPLLAGYSVTDAWDRVSSQGCMDHAAPLQPVRGYHAVVIVAHGTLSLIGGGPWVYIENSWGAGWGWNGIGVMSEALHLKMIGELWSIV